jgi:hypothetical protein
VSSSIGCVGKDAGAAALGILATNTINHYYSKSCRRSKSVNDNQNSYYHYCHCLRYHSCSYSLSHLRAKTLIGIGLSATALASKATLV